MSYYTDGRVQSRKHFSITLKEAGKHDLKKSKYTILGAEASAGLATGPTTARGIGKELQLTIEEIRDPCGHPKTRKQ